MSVWSLFVYNTNQTLNTVVKYCCKILLSNTVGGGYHSYTVSVCLCTYELCKTHLFLPFWGVDVIWL